MQDYQGNSRKAREEKIAPDKKIEKVVVGEVVVPKRSIGQKFKSLIIEADFRSVAGYVVYDVLIPAVKNMMVDASRQGIERMVYGDRAVRYRNYGPGSRVTYQSYQTPVSRGYPAPPIARLVPPYADTGRRPFSIRAPESDFILSSREDAEGVLDQLNDIVENYDFATVGDLKELLGIVATHVDNKWGWHLLGNIPIRQIREGFILELPPAEPFQG